MKVSVDTSTLSRGRLGNITGVVFLAHARWAFPERAWNDFPVIVIAWWLEALSSREQNQVECAFMDGPFAFRVSRASGGKWRIECRGRSSGPSRVALVQPSPFMRSLYTAGRNLVSACQKHGWRSREISRLARLSVHTRVGTGA